tara:strand:+ start:1019 stop:1324 length:306 start_codon:yes stop_codon:yes gene_type:complete
MSEHTKTFIDNLEAGKNADAGQAFKDALRDKMGNALDARRQELAASLFNKTPEADPISDPKPEIADVGTFTADGQVQTSNDPQNDGKAEIEIAGNGETQAQ